MKIRVDLGENKSDKLSFKNTCIRTLLTNKNKVKFLDYHVLSSYLASKILLQHKTYNINF